MVLKNVHDTNILSIETLTVRMNRAPKIAVNKIKIDNIKDFPIKSPQKDGAIHYVEILSSKHGQRIGEFKKFEKLWCNFFEEAVKISVVKNSFEPLLIVYRKLEDYIFQQLIPPVTSENDRQTNLRIQNNFLLIDFFKNFTFDHKTLRNSNNGNFSLYLLHNLFSFLKSSSFEYITKDIPASISNKKDPEEAEYKEMVHQLHSLNNSIVSLDIDLSDFPGEVFSKIKHFSNTSVGKNRIKKLDSEDIFFSAPIPIEDNNSNEAPLSGFSDLIQKLNLHGNEYEPVKFSLGTSGSQYDLRLNTFGEIRMGAIPVTLIKHLLGKQGYHSLRKKLMYLYVNRVSSLSNITLNPGLSSQQEIDITISDNPTNRVENTTLLIPRTPSHSFGNAIKDSQSQQAFSKKSPHIKLYSRNPPASENITAAEKDGLILGIGFDDSNKGYRISRLGWIKPIEESRSQKTILAKSFTPEVASTIIGTIEHVNSILGTTKYTQPYAFILKYLELNYPQLEVPYNTFTDIHICENFIQDCIQNTNGLKLLYETYVNPDDNTPEKVLQILP